MKLELLTYYFLIYIKFNTFISEDKLVKLETVKLIQCLKNKLFLRLQ